MKEGKMRKFDDKEQTIRQSSVSTTESTLILSGYSRELANIWPQNSYTVCIFIYKPIPFLLEYNTFIIPYTTENYRTGCQIILANSLEYPETIQRGLEWTQLLKRLLVLCVFFSCHQIFSFFPLSAFSFYTVQYRRVQYSTGIYLVPRYYSVV